MVKFIKICTADGAFILDVRSRDTIIYTNQVVNILKTDFACNGAFNGSDEHILNAIKSNHLIILLFL